MKGSSHLKREKYQSGGMDERSHSISHIPVLYSVCFYGTSAPVPFVPLGTKSWFDLFQPVLLEHDGVRLQRCFHFCLAGWLGSIQPPQVSFSCRESTKQVSSCWKTKVVVALCEVSLMMSICVDRILYSPSGCEE